MPAFSRTISRISRSVFLVCSRSGKGDVVVQVHRAEQRAVLEQHAELAPDAVQVLLAHADDLLAVDPDLAGVGRSRPMMFFSSTDLPVPDGPMMAVMRPLGRRS